MERVISPEERMRRAEEIYYRRRSQGVRVSTNSMNMGKGSKVSLGRKMIIQILVCTIIYTSFWLLKSYNNVFSENIIGQTKSVLSYDVNFQKLYKECKEYLGNNFNSIIKTNIGEQDNNSAENGQSKDGTSNGKEKQIENTETNNTDTETNDNQNLDNAQSINVNDNADNTEEQNKTEEVNDENLGVGGGSDTSEIINGDGTQKAKIDAENKTQMEQDAEYIKQNCSLIHPLEGVITSKFGAREETDIISAFHQGIDIAASTGTAIHASMEGTVVAASYAGDYGNHIKIQNGEVLTVYAHCSQLEVNVGEYVQQGQEIGKVGATGKVTRTSFTF